MIHVVATIEVQAGRRADFLQEFHRVAALVRAEAGCVEYEPAIDIPTPIAVQDPAQQDAVVVIEKWESLEALQDHLKAPHMADYRVRVKDLVRGVRLRVLESA